jgi:hypothetical protein
MEFVFIIWRYLTHPQSAVKQLSINCNPVAGRLTAAVFRHGYPCFDQPLLEQMPQVRAFTLKRNNETDKFCLTQKCFICYTCGRKYRIVFHIVEY